jgi:hypothetical protein
MWLPNGSRSAAAGDRQGRVLVRDDLDGDDLGDAHFLGVWAPPLSPPPSPQQLIDAQDRRFLGDPVFYPIT